MKIAALIIFIVMYVLMVAVPSKRLWVCAGAALLYIITGITGITSVPSAINWNVILMMFGTMIVVYYFIESGMPNVIADKLIDRADSVMWFTIILALFSGFISAFIDNVATVLMIAPIGLAACKKYSINPVPVLLAIAVSSNLQGAATLVGDTTSIMLGAYADMDFVSFFWMNGRPGIFFAVEIGALLTVPVMMFLFRKDRQSIKPDNRAEAKSVWPTVMIVMLVLGLIGASFIKNKPGMTNGLICMAFAVICMAADIISGKRTDGAVKGIKSADFITLLFLMCIFIVIQGIVNMGIVDDFADLIVRAGGDNIFLLYTIIVWGSVIISAFIDNIPYVATMLPVIAGISLRLGVEPHLLYFGLLCGATLGGNITPIGASANITAVGMLQKEGYKVSFGDFMRIGVPFTVTACLAGYLFIWIFWH